MKGTEETRKRLQTINKEVSALNDDVTKKELKLENVLGARHQVLVDARLNGVSLPLTQGTESFMYKYQENCFCQFWCNIIILKSRPKYINLVLYL